MVEWQWVDGNMVLVVPHEDSASVGGRGGREWAYDSVILVSKVVPVGIGGEALTVITSAGCEVSAPGETVTP